MIEFVCGVDRAVCGDAVSGARERRREPDIARRRKDSAGSERDRVCGRQVDVRCAVTVPAILTVVGFADGELSRRPWWRRSGGSHRPLRASRSAATTRSAENTNDRRSHIQYACSHHAIKGRRTSHESRLRRACHLHGPCFCTAPPSRLRHAGPRITVTAPRKLRSRAAFSVRLPPIERRPVNRISPTSCARGGECRITNRGECGIVSHRDGLGCIDHCRLDVHRCGEGHRTRLLTSSSPESAVIACRVEMEPLRPALRTMSPALAVTAPFRFSVVAARLTEPALISPSVVVPSEKPSVSP